MRTYVCPVCGAEFQGWPSGKKVCSQPCEGVRRRKTATADTLGRSIALARYPDVQPCEVCGKFGLGRGVIDRHHRDSDRLNNTPENIAFLCRKHHNDAHRLTDGKVGGGPRPRIVALMRDRAMAMGRTAAAMRDDGQSVPSIAAQFQVHPATVTRWFKKYDL